MVYYHKRIFDKFCITSAFVIHQKAFFNFHFWWHLEIKDFQLFFIVSVPCTHESFIGKKLILSSVKTAHVSKMFANKKRIFEHICAQKGC
jgi:hypothetical protein